MPHDRHGEAVQTSRMQTCPGAHLPGDPSFAVRTPQTPSMQAPSLQLLWSGHSSCATHSCLVSLHQHPDTAANATIVTTCLSFM
jgi:hypothetical protein